MLIAPQCLNFAARTSTKSSSPNCAQRTSAPARARVVYPQGRTKGVATASITTVSTSDVRFDPTAVRVESASTGTTASRSNGTTNYNDDAYIR